MSRVDEKGFLEPGNPVNFVICTTSCASEVQETAWIHSDSLVKSRRTQVSKANGPHLLSGAEGKARLSR